MTNQKDKNGSDLDQQVVALLSARGGDPLTLRQIRERLDVAADQRRDLRHTLARLVEDGVLTQRTGRRYSASVQAPTVEGVAVRHIRGFGFLTQLRGLGLTEDPLIPPHELASVLPGDVVRARLEKGRGGRLRAVDVVPLTKDPVVSGVLVRAGKHLMLEVDTLDAPLRVLGAEVDEPPAPGFAVEMRVTERPDVTRSGGGVVVRVLGKAGTLAVEVQTLIRLSGVPVPFTPAALRQAQEASGDIMAEAARGEPREDLTALPLVTMDGEDARDFDDAIHVARHGKDLVLTVAIADVAHYVTEGSPLDADAVNRGTSTYFPGQVIPMLPERLSNDLCSLRPHVPRLCMVAEMTFAPGAALPKKERFFAAVMRSAARMTYIRVQQAWDVGLKQLPEAPGFDLAAAMELYHRLWAGRLARGALDLDVPEPNVQLGRDGEPAGLEAAPRLDTHRLIEAFMIAANESVARFFADRNIPTVFRIHESPDEEKLERFRSMANVYARGMHLGPYPRPQQLSRFLETIKAHPSARVLQPLLLRSMMQARYDTSNKGHYGLASEAYLHFTSPIRRYPDLLVHRALKKALAHRKGKAHADPGVQQKLQALAERNSNAERRSTDLERKMDSLYAARWAQKHLGQEFDGAVSGVAESGLYVQMASLGVDGLLPADALGRDEWQVHPSGALLMGQRTRAMYALGQVMRVRIADANLTRRQVQLELVEAQGLPALNLSDTGRGGKPRKADAGRPQTRSPPAARRAGAPPKGRSGAGGRRGGRR